MKKSRFTEEQITYALRQAESGTHDALDYFTPAVYRQTDHPGISYGWAYQADLTIGSDVHAEVFGWMSSRVWRAWK